MNREPMLISRTNRTWCSDYSDLFIRKAQERKRHLFPPTPPVPPLPNAGISYWAIGSTFVVGGYSGYVVDEGNYIVDGIDYVIVTE